MRDTNRHPDRHPSEVSSSELLHGLRSPAGAAADTVDHDTFGTASNADREGTPRPFPAVAIADVADVAEPGDSEPVPLRRRLLTLDIVVIALVWIGVGLVRRSPTDASRVAWLLLETSIVTAVTLFSLDRLGLYRARICSDRRVARQRLVLVAVLAVVTAWVVDPGRAGQGVQARLVVCGVILYVALVVGREIFEQWLRASRVRGRFQRSVLVVGTLAEVEKVVGLLEAHPETGCRAVGWLGEYEGPSTEPNMATVPWVGPISDVVNAVGLTDAMSVLVGPSVAASPELNPIARELHADDVHVQLWTGLWSVDHRRLHASPIAHEPFFYLEPAGPASGKLWLKRGIDVVVASAMLVLTAPILLITALLIKLNDRGPVFFLQERVGLEGRTFRLHKFRTMRVDAEAELAELQEQNERNGPLFKMESDPRITRVGRVLRVTSIDELPQLFDVLAGRLSLVGPRPALPDEVAEFDDELQGRHRVTPGVTGLWQVEARHNPSFYAYRHLDLFYVENWTLGLDVVILLATAKTVITDGIHELWATVDRRGKARSS